MLIEAIRKRKNGSRVPLKGTMWHFKPKNPDDPKSPHVCDVTDDEAAQILLNLPISYRRVSVGKPRKKKAEGKPITDDKEMNDAIDAAIADTGEE